MKLSLVVPCYNEENNISLFYEEVKKCFKDKKFKYEIIFINDGSQDNTIYELKKIVENKENVKIINFSRNFGKEAAMYAGLKESKGKYISIIDADLQQKPSLILEMLDILEKNSEYDSVAAYQEKRKDPLTKKFFSNLFYKLINSITEVEFVSGASDFRVFRKNMADAIVSMDEYYRFSKGIFSWVGFNTYYMPYEPEKRIYGKTKWSFKKLFRYAVEGVVSFTTTPLTISTILGLIISLLSFVYLSVVIIQTFMYGTSIPGYASTIGTILLLGGIQLLSLGIIGTYLARTYVETKKRPIYIVKEIINNKK